MTKENLTKLREVINLLGEIIDDEIKSLEDTDTETEYLSSKNEIHYYLKQMGMSAKLKGTKYLEIAIKKVLENPDGYYSITKVLYPEIAKETQSTDKRVEKAIRGVIEKAFREKNELVEKIFKHLNSYSEKGRPTNSEFIFELADYIRQA